MDEQNDFSLLPVFKPHASQAKILNSMKQFNFIECHRSFGKTVLGLGTILTLGLHSPYTDGQYAYLAPEEKQGVDLVWDRLVAMVDRIPGKKVLKSERTVVLPNGVKLLIRGLSDFNTKRGMRLDGIVLDEFGTMPNAEHMWKDVIKATLLHPRINPDDPLRFGWVMFCGTPPRDPTHYYYELYYNVINDPEWYVTKFPITETGLYTPSEVESFKKGLDENTFLREMMCIHFLTGDRSYYQQGIKDLEEVRSIGEYPYMPGQGVITGWDLGLDGTAIWFAQVRDDKINIIDYYEDLATDKTIKDFIRVLRTKPYSYSKHILPHDAVKTTLMSKDSVKSLLTKEYPGIVRIAKREAVHEGIMRAKDRLYLCRFNKSTTTRGIQALLSYAPDARGDGSVKAKPLHNWASHGADAFRYLLNNINIDSDNGFGQSSLYNRSKMPQKAIDGFGTYDT